MQRFRLDVGRRNQVKPGNIVGAIANEAELESKYIGEIEIRDDYTTVDLPADMPKEIMTILKNTRVAGRPLGLRIYKGEDVTSLSGKYGDEIGEHSKLTKPRKKSYNSKKRDRGEASKKPKSDYAKKKYKDRKKG